MDCGRGCKENWDVRCCCEFNCPAKNSNLQFYRCNMMINTIVFHIGNDYSLYSMAEENNFSFIEDYFKIDDEIIKSVIIQQWLDSR